MNFDSFWWGKVKKFACATDNWHAACLAFALCVENWPICHYANLYCREQMSFVTKNVGRLWQFLRNAWLLPKIFWRKLLITLKKVVTYFPFSCYVPLLLLNHVKRKKKSLLNLFWQISKFPPCRCHWTLWWNYWFSCSLPNGIDYQAVFT